MGSLKRYPASLRLACKPCAGLKMGFRLPLAERNSCLQAMAQFAKPS
ncbi:hypothetical protein GCWU000324_00729 [Kingella oralis ATCC 51147]|uniref:Uncharacterized protein n=1 Tax=Kingella oralis ATCC 51147 TaxID=629741 RepID=C4GF20_9NEIS|nr:hypothetical protein GCWU000324_00729 [Kingella oralis ATCC 51147]